MTVMGKIHSVETFGTVDGPGIRYIIFLQGCPLRCQYCHNPDTWKLQDGKDISVEELMDDIVKYIPFMKSSGGGVTISGGEPTMQMAFVKALLTELKKHNIHTCLDTSGFVHEGALEEVIDLIDLVLLDIKHIDPQKHQSLTGVSNERTLHLANRLSERGIGMWIRHVVVPTLTDHPKDVANLGKFIASLKTVKKVELLPYHTMGKYKWKASGLNYPLEGLRDATDLDLQKVQRILDQFNIPTKDSVVA